MAIQPVVVADALAVTAVGVVTGFCIAFLPSFLKKLELIIPYPVSGQRVPLYHPRRDRWGAHFAWSDDFRLMIDLTPTGRATVEVLHLNRDGVINLRRSLYAIGQHPPARAEGNES